MGRRSGEGGKYRILIEGNPKVDVECWCRNAIVRVPIEDVRAGLTGPCHRNRCRARDAAARKGPDASLRP